VRSRIASLLAIPLVMCALFAIGTGVASAQTNFDSAILHLRGQLQLPSAGKPAEGAAVSAETCYWDVYIFRADPTGKISGRTEVSCDAVMAQITAQVVLLNNGNPRGEASLTTGFANTSYWETRLTFPVACLSGVNQAYGSVYVQSYSGLAASDFGYSASTITC
jgi:hypothetical protein